MPLRQRRPRSRSLKPLRSSSPLSSGSHIALAALLHVYVEYAPPLPQPPPLATPTTITSLPLQIFHPGLLTASLRRCILHLPIRPLRPPPPHGPLSRGPLLRASPAREIGAPRRRLTAPSEESRWWMRGSQPPRGKSCGELMWRAVGLPDLHRRQKRFRLLLQTENGRRTLSQRPSELNRLAASRCLHRRPEQD